MESMERRTLAHTDLNVSRFCFGTMTLGKPLDQAGTTQIVDRCLDAGINFFDTANVYNAGVAETMLGKALKGKPRQGRSRQQSGLQDGRRARSAGLSRKAILRAIDESLRAPADRLSRPLLPAPARPRRTDRRNAGGDGVAGASRARCAIRRARTTRAGRWCRCSGSRKSGAGMPPYVSQPMYNLLARGIEQEYLAMCKEFGVSTVVYNPLAGGLLTGKHRAGRVLPGTRFDNNTALPGPLLARRNISTPSSDLREIAQSRRTLARQPGAELAAASHGVRRGDPRRVEPGAVERKSRRQRGRSAARRRPERVRSGMAGPARTAAGVQPLKQFTYHHREQARPPNVWLARISRSACPESARLALRSQEFPALSKENKS